MKFFINLNDTSRRNGKIHIMSLKWADYRGMNHATIFFNGECESPVVPSESMDEIYRHCNIQRGTLINFG